MTHTTTLPATDTPTCSDEAEVTCACPYCGSTELAGNDLIQASVAIQSFCRDGDTVVPEWGGESDVDWDSSRPADDAVMFRCEDCGGEFQTPRVYPHDDDDNPIEDEPAPGAFAALAADNARTAQRFTRARDRLWQLLATLEASVADPGGPWMADRDRLLRRINAPTGKEGP